MVLDPRFFAQYATPIAPAPSVPQYSGQLGNAIRGSRALAERRRESEAQEQLAREAQEHTTERTRMGTLGVAEMRRGFELEDRQFAMDQERVKMKRGYTTAYADALANNDPTAAAKIRQIAAGDGFSIETAQAAPMPQDPRMFVGPLTSLPMPPSPPPGSIIVRDGQTGEETVLPPLSPETAARSRQDRIEQILRSQGVGQTPEERIAIAGQIASQFPTERPNDAFKNFMAMNTLLSKKEMRRRGTGGKGGGKPMKKVKFESDLFDKGFKLSKDAASAIGFKDQIEMRGVIEDTWGKANDLLDAVKRGDSQNMGVIAKDVQKNIAKLQEGGSRLTDKDAEFAKGLMSVITVIQDMWSTTSAGLPAPAVVEAQVASLKALRSTLNARYARHLENMRKGAEDVGHPEKVRGGLNFIARIAGKEAATGKPKPGPAKDDSETKRKVAEAFGE